MPKFRIEFKRYIPDDEEIVGQEFPELPVAEGLVAQFQKEIGPGYTIVRSYIRGDYVYVTTVSVTDAHVTPAEFAKALQARYDDEGIAGFFEVYEEPDKP